MSLIRRTVLRSIDVRDDQLFLLRIADSQIQLDIAEGLPHSSFCFPIRMQHALRGSLFLLGLVGDRSAAFAAIAKMLWLHPRRIGMIGVVQRSFVGFNGPVSVFLNILVCKRHVKFIKTLSMKQANTIDLKLKELLNTASKDYAWQVLQLQISLEGDPKPPLDALMRLIQLYMLGVELLENEDDQRFTYFNHKIHSIMMKKSVVQQLHRIATGSAPDPQTIDLAQKMQLQTRKNEYDLQISLQKDMYTMNNVKDIIRKHERQSMRKNQHMKEQIEGQNMVLEERIRSRKMRSISKGKQNEEEKSPKMVSKASYGSYSNSDKEKQDPKPEKAKPHQKT